MIYILGAGAMGCLWAAHLQQTQDVCFLSTRAQAPNQTTFNLDAPFTSPGKSEIQIPTISHKDVSHIDTLLLCTKSNDAKCVAKDLKPLLSADSKVVLFQNGLGSHFSILQDLKTPAIFAAVTTEGANRPDSNTVIHAGKGLTKLGPLNDAARLEQNSLPLFNKLAKSDLEIVQEENIWRALWTKLAINCAINPYTAILDCANGDIKETDLFRETWPSLKAELSSLLSLAGYSMPEDELENQVFSVMSRTSKNISSMLQDIRVGKQTEIGDINGFASEYLAQHQKEHGTNQQLTEQVRSIESTLIRNSNIDLGEA